METNLSPSQIELLKEAFDTTDLNEDNMITTDELGTALRFNGLNPSFAEITKYVNEINKDQRGRISFDDFTMFMADKMNRVDSPENIIDAFQAFDVEQKGFVSANELRYVLTTSGEKLKDQEMNEMIKLASVDGKGNIDYREFVKMMQNE